MKPMARWAYNKRQKYCGLMGHVWTPSPPVRGMLTEECSRCGRVMVRVFLEDVR